MDNIVINRLLKHRFIILCQDHYNPLAIVRSLGEEGIRPIVILCDKHPYKIIHSKYIGELHIFDTIKQGLDYIISNYSDEEYKAFIYDGSDDIGKLIDDNYEILKNNFYFFNAEGNLSKYQDKYAITKLAKEFGLNIPKEEILQVGTLPKSLRYPVFTKAITSGNGGTWKDQSFICKNEKELLDAYSNIKVDTILVQEFIDKKNELCIDGISINGGNEIFMPYSCGYYRFIPGAYGNYMKFIPFLDEELTKKIHKLIQYTKYSGIFCIEFMIDKEDNLHFLEINFRHSGWGYAFTYGGFNLPVRWAISTLNKKLYLDGFKYLDQFDAMEEVQDLRDCITYHKIPLLKWYKDFRKSGCHLQYNPNDNAPFWSEVKTTISRILKRKFGLTKVVTSK